MSVINKKPFIKTLIESLSDANLATLRTMIDGGGSQTVLLRTTSNTFTNSERTRITNSDKGVHRCSLEVQGGLYTWNGYLIFNNSYCVLIYYTNNFQSLGWLKVNADFQGIEYIGEELSIIELRSELDDTAAAEQAEIISVVNEGIGDGNVNISANPTLAGTEAALEGLQVGSTKYKIGGGAAHCYYLKVKMNGLNFPVAYYAFNYYTNADLTTLSDFYTDLLTKYPDGYPISSKGSSSGMGTTNYAHRISPKSTTNQVQISDIIAFLNSDNSVHGINSQETAFELDSNSATITKIY